MTLEVFNTSSTKYSWAIFQFSLRYIIMSQKYHDISKYCDIIVWDHVTIANSKRSKKNS